jgi:hypothetical protein
LLNSVPATALPDRTDDDRLPVCSAAKRPSASQRRNVVIEMLNACAAAPVPASRSISERVNKSQSDRRRTVLTLQAPGKGAGAARRSSRCQRGPSISPARLTPPAMLRSGLIAIGPV